MDATERKEPGANMVAFSLQDLQERFGVGEHTVLGWARQGELKAIDVRRSGSSRAKWRITEEALIEFETSRASRTLSPVQVRRRSREPQDVIGFY